MKCKKCDYRLWNLRSRLCPECGLPFKPSEYTFVPSSVRYCCLHCGQDYYGTSPEGHLLPREFSCVKCHKPVNMDEMVLLPTAGIDEEQTEIERMPWLNRKKLGTLRAWFKTVGMALINPTRVIQLLPTDAKAGPAVRFAVVTNLLLAIPTIVLFMVVVVIGAGAAGGFAAGGLAIIGMMGAGFLSIVLYSYLGVWLWSLVAHGILRITGKTERGIGRTCTAIGYSSGANALTAIPICGAYVGWIWWAVSATLMVREAQKVHGFRAVLAVLAPPLLVVGAYFGVAIFFVAAAGSSGVFISPGGFGAFARRGTETTRVTGAIVRYAGEHQGRLPRHAIELVHEGYITSHDLVVPSTRTVEADVAVGSTDLENFIFLSEKERERVIEEAVAALGPKPVAHRLGDFIFIYHGADKQYQTPDLWLVCRVGDSPNHPVVAGFASGTTMAIVSNGPFRDQQNTLRKSLGLPPLPAFEPFFPKEQPESPDSVTDDGG